MLKTLLALSCLCLLCTNILFLSRQGEFLKEFSLMFCHPLGLLSTLFSSSQQAKLTFSCLIWNFDSAMLSVLMESRIGILGCKF